MKNQIILWLSSIIIVFLIGYIKNVTDSDYPVTGTFGIESKKVSYKLDKVSFDKKSYKNIIISDIRGIEARLFWIYKDNQYETLYKEIAGGLECEIPILKPGQEIKYKLLIKYNEKIFEIFQKEFVLLKFWGNIPSPVKIFYFILLYSGLLMVVRSMLELFNRNKNLKKYSIIAITLFITLNTIIYPLFTTYKLGAINNFVPPISDLFNPLLIIILASWVVGTILIFNNIYTRVVTIIISTITILIFFLM